MKSHKLVIVGIFFSLFSAPSFSLPTLKVGTTGDYPPFTNYDKQTKQFSDFDIDMAKSPGICRK